MKNIFIVIVVVFISTSAISNDLLTDVYIDSPRFLRFEFPDDRIFELTPSEINSFEIDGYDEISLNQTNNHTGVPLIHEHQEHPVIYGIDGTFRYTNKSITKAIVAANHRCLSWYETDVSDDITYIPYYIWSGSDVFDYKEIDKPPYFAPKLKSVHEDPDYVIDNNVKFKCVIPLLEMESVSSSDSGISTHE